MDAGEGDLEGVEGDLGSFADRLGDLFGGFGEGKSPRSCLTLAGSVGEFPESCSGVWKCKDYFQY